HPESSDLCPGVECAFSSGGKICRAVAPGGAAARPAMNGRTPSACQAIETDVLVIGGGLAGLRAAISARKAGARVLIAVKRLLGRSGSSSLTTGGYAAAAPELNARDDAELHYIDTVVGGGFVNDRALVRALVEEAPARVTELWDMGARFRTRDGNYHLSPS